MGADDPGSHAHRGPTPRTDVMFGQAGHLYVYFTYGMHWCVNVVCGEVGVASAVLLRAVTPLDGLDVMRVRRPKARRNVDLCNGPAKLASAFGFDGGYDGLDLQHNGVGVQIIDDGTHHRRVRPTPFGSDSPMVRRFRGDGRCQASPTSADPGPDHHTVIRGSSSVAATQNDRERPTHRPLRSNAADAPPRFRPSHCAG